MSSGVLERPIRINRSRPPGPPDSNSDVSTDESILMCGSGLSDDDDDDTDMVELNNATTFVDVNATSEDDLVISSDSDMSDEDIIVVNEDSDEDDEGVSWRLRKCQINLSNVSNRFDLKSKGVLNVAKSYPQEVLSVRIRNRLSLSKSRKVSSPKMISLGSPKHCKVSLNNVNHVDVNENVDVNASDEV